MSFFSRELVYGCHCKHKQTEERYLSTVACDTNGQYFVYEDLLYVFVQLYDDVTISYNQLGLNEED